MGSYLNSSSGATLCQLHKFGGSSLADTECYLRAAAITAEYSQPRDVIVVSAAGSTTNQLIEWLTQSQRDKMAGLRIMLALRTYQSALIHELLTADVAAQLYKNLIDDFERLAGLLDAKITDAVYAEVVGQGEIWSARLMAALLTQQGINAVWIDSRDFLRAERSALPQIDGDDSLLRLRPLLAQYATSRLVVTGFISRNKKEETVLLGRNGSDYSATQIGALIGAKRVTIWSDVDGVYSADPRKVNDACLLPMLRLDEASELARLAAPVLHARTLQPVYSSDIELLLRNSYRPEQGLTQIERILASGSGAKIVTSHDEVSLIELTIDDGVAFTAVEKALKQFLHREQIRALAVGIRADRRLIQLCYTAEVVASALEKLKEADFPARCQLRSGLSLVALVGAGVGKNPLHCHRFYQQLKDQPVEFICHAQDDISLAAVLRLNSTEFIIQGLHKSLFQAKKRVGLVLFGKGNIGSCWLELFIREQESLSLRSGIEFILAGIADSQKGCFDYEGLDTGTLLADYSHVAKEYDETALLTWMKAHPFDDLAVLDITASHLLAQRYLDFAHCGFHVISANKAAGAARGDSYRQVRDAFSKTGRYWLYNATVGAGLPINHTVRDLRDSGDTVLSISGIFSGTLSWLFQQFDGSTPFTALVEQAWQQGLTEPDPRMDLSGQDVMRKLVILAREAGYDIEPDQVRVESLVPDNLTHGSVDGFFEHGQALDTQMLERLNAAKKRGLVLRYVARFEANGKASIGVEAVEGNHPLAALLPCDNVFAIESRWYRDNPLIIRGPGAGREVTAGAIQSDINRLSRLL